MYLSKKDIENSDRKYRLNLINSITGAKPANLVGTVDLNGNANLAIISSVVHIGSNPALLGFMVRPTGEVPRHTYENIRDTEVYSINSVSNEMIRNAHYTSAKFPREVNEFERCNIESSFIDGFAAPFVKNSVIQLGMRFVQEIDIPINGTRMILGSNEHLNIMDQMVAENGYVNLENSGISAIGGLNTYYKLQKVDSFPYVRTDEVPEFSQT